MRGSAAAHSLGTTNLNPFGDLHTLQHLSVRLARALKGVWEPLLRQEVRSWAEPLSVQRFTDYRAERPDTLTAWLPLAMTGPATTGTIGNGMGLVVLDGRWVLEVLDQFFGGSGHAPAVMPTEFSPAAEAMVGRLGLSLAAPAAGPHGSRSRASSSRRAGSRRAPRCSRDSMPTRRSS